jgi:hypothetical protein
MSVPMIRQEMALTPALSVQDLTARAKLVVDSGLAPRDMTPQQLAVIMLKGQELGLRPLEAMESLYVVQGKVGEMTHQLVNMLRQAGHDYHIDETTMEQCAVTIYRSDGQRYTHTVTFKECDDAKWNQYWDTKASVWKVKPTWQGGGQRTMLTYRTISQAIKLYCPEVLHQQPGRQPARAQVVAAPVDLASAWYTYTRQLIESEGIENVVKLVQSMADGEDSPEMVDGAEYNGAEYNGAEDSADDAIDAEFFEEEGDPEPVEATVVAPPPPAGAPPAKPTRPYPPELVREAIQSRAAKGAPEIAAQGVRGATVGALEALFIGASKESKAHMRHQLGTFLLGKGTSNEWTHGECNALIQWAQTRQDDGAMVPTEMACKEAEAIIRSLDSQGQMEIPL